MSLKNNKYARRLAAALMTGTMMVSMLGMTAMAQGGEPGDEPVKAITKVLEKDATLYAPKTEFEFTISPATGGLDKVDGVTVQPGPAEGVLFSTDEGNAATATIPSSPDKGAVTDTRVTLGSLNIVLDQNKFSGVGIYRYEIKETTGSFAGVSYDTTTEYLDVHVTNKTGGGYDYTYTIINSSDSSAKGDGTFTNSYKKANNNLYDLKVTKNIEGNQANMSDTFNFSIQIDSDVTGEQFYVVVYDKAGTATEQVKTVIGDDSNGQTFTLGDDQYAVIYGLSTKDRYTVTEIDANTDDYYTTSSIDNAKPTENATIANTEDIMGDVDITFINTRKASTPTGVILNIAPYILMVALAGVLAFFFLRKRRYDL